MQILFITFRLDKNDPMCAALQQSEINGLLDRGYRMIDLYAPGSWVRPHEPQYCDIVILPSYSSIKSSTKRLTDSMRRWL